MKIRIIATLLFLSTVTTAAANDTAFGGGGATPMPIREGNVQMKDEHIVISGKDINSGNLDGHWKYACDYTFKNLSDKSVALKMGFPFPVRSEEEAVTVPKGYKLKNGDPIVYDFTVKINDKLVNTQFYSISPNLNEQMDYKGAYIWDMTFQPNEEIKVYHNYLTGITFNVMGQIWVSYVLRTGGLWQGGKIGAAKLEVIPNTPTRLCNELDEQTKPPALVGMKIIGKKAERKYVWNLKNFSPQMDLELCLQTGRDYIRYHVVYPIAEGSDSIQLDKMSLLELRFLRNAIYAQYGRGFQDAQMQDYFNQQWWYEPNPNYSDSSLTKEDKQALEFILKCEKQRAKT